jgi:NAD(P)-dependent dehydrogenase (short-subunit alcohol dehydrogenase family)
MTKAHQKVALVTGANKGIGYAIAAELAAGGMSVLLAARDAHRGEQAAAALRSAGRDVHPVVLDVTDLDTAHATVRYIDERYGRLDVLVNNAGITGPRGMASVDLDVVRAVFETNVFGVITVTNALLPLLRRAPCARIVNLSSSVGSFARTTDPDSPFANLPPSASYAPSKAALNALTVHYAKELRDTNILVNAADPGGTATDMTKAFGYRLDRSPAQAASIAVRLATLGPDGPTGGFFDENGPVPW